MDAPMNKPAVCAFNSEALDEHNRHSLVWAGVPITICTACLQRLMNAGYKIIND